MAFATGSGSKSTAQYTASISNENLESQINSTTEEISDGSSEDSLSQEAETNNEQPSSKSVIKKIIITSNQSVLTQEYNEAGLLIKETENGGIWGFEEREYQYDEYGRLVSWTCDTHPEGLITCFYFYNADGTLAEYRCDNAIGGGYSETFTYENGELVSSHFDSYDYCADRDYENGLLIFEAYTDGNPVYNPDDYFDVYYVQFRYDEYGNEIETNYITGAGGHIIPRTSTINEYDSDGKLIRKTFTRYVDAYYDYYNWDESDPYKVSYIEETFYEYEFY